MFDLSNVESNKKNDTLPADKYVCNVTDAVVKDTKSGTGEYISVTFTVNSGEHAKRKIFSNFNIRNPNPKAVEIGLQQLKSMVECIDGMTMKFETPFEFCSSVVGKTVGVKTKITNDETYGEKAEVHYYYKPGASEVSSPSGDDQIGF